MNVRMASGTRLLSDLKLAAPITAVRAPSGRHVNTLPLALVIP
jgi:hypothetical protein